MQEKTPPVLYFNHTPRLPPYPLPPLAASLLLIALTTPKSALPAALLATIDAFLFTPPSPFFPTFAA